MVNGRSVTALVGGVIVAGLVTGGVVLLFTEDNRWSGVVVLSVALLAAYSLVRNLAGRVSDSSDGPVADKWWHKVVAVVCLGAAFTIKGLGTLGLSVGAALANAALCLGVFGVIGAVVAFFDWVQTKDDVVDSPKRQSTEELLEQLAARRRLKD